MNKHEEDLEEEEEEEEMQYREEEVDEDCEITWLWWTPKLASGLGGLADCLVPVGSVLQHMRPF